MNELEDEPEDVQNASPVEDEVKLGETDAVSSKKLDAAAKSTKESGQQHSCTKAEKPIQKADCCKEKRKKAVERQEKTAVVYVHEPPCKLPKPEITPRHCFSKKEYLDFLATPKEKCSIPCEKRPVVRRVRTMPPRIVELAKPMKRRVMMTLEEQGMNMRPENLFNMIEMLEAFTAFSPEQAQHLVRDRAQLKRKRKRKKEKSKCNKVKCNNVQKMLAAGDPSLDLDAVNCQYFMAVRFVKSIFNFKCSAPREQYRDIAAVVLCRLSQLLEYTPIGNEDRKSQQMRILADIIACWIMDLLVEVSERNKDELEGECNKRRKELEEQLAREALEEEEERDLDMETDSEDSEDSDSRKNAVTDTASLALTTAKSEADEVAISASTQYDKSLLEEDMVEESEVDETETMMDKENEESIKSEGGSEAGVQSSIVVVEEGKDEEVQTAPDAEDDYDRVKSEQELARLRELEKSLSRVTHAFKSDIPFIDFSKICETIYSMIECDSENALNDPMDNLVHRAIYEKFEYVIRQDNPALLTDYIKDVVDVISGKIAKWLRKTLNDRQIKFLEECPPEIESKEVRDWSKWIAKTAKMAEDWAGWINQVTDDVGCMKQKGKITRGSWKDWTGKFEKNAMLWRRAYLEAIHQEHHNNMMMANRKVCKTGFKQKPEFSEMAIKATNFDSESKCNE